MWKYTVGVIGWQKASVGRESGAPVRVIQIIAHAVVLSVAFDGALGSLEVSRAEPVNDCPSRVDLRQTVVHHCWM